MEEDGCWILTDILMYWCQVFSFQITFTNIMGQSTSKGKISQEDLQFLLKNTNHSKEEIMVSWYNLHPHSEKKHWSVLTEEKVNLRSQTANPWCDDIRNISFGRCSASTIHCFLRSITAESLSLQRCFSGTRVVFLKILIFCLMRVLEESFVLIE